MEDRARAAAAASRTRSADSERLRQSYLTPGLAGQSITTIDGQTSFTPSLACQRSATLLQLLVKPDPSGDIGMLSIARDIDLNGQFDSSSTLPVPVSGICANGVISCAPGTWNACHFFQWTVDGAAQIKLAEVAPAALTGCYCINNSCGSNLVLANLASVLTDLGGGVVGALTSADPRIGIAQARIEGPVISYVGAQATACAADPAVAQTGYKASAATLGPDGMAAASASSLFQALTASAAGTGLMRESRNCAVERQLAVDGASGEAIIARVAGGYATVPGDGAVDFLLGAPGNDYLYGGSCGLFDYRMTLHVAEPDRIMTAVLSEIAFDDWVQLRIDGQLVVADPAAWTGTGLPPGNCERGRTWHAAPGIDLKPFLGRGNHEIWLRVAVGTRGEALARIHVTLDERCRTSERIDDGCAALATNPVCRLTDEQVDQVETVRRGIATGLSPLPQTRIVGTAACSMPLTRAFFAKARRYSCALGAGTIMKPDLSRSAYIIDQSTEALLADRRRRTDGSIEETSRPFSRPARTRGPACEPICKASRKRDAIDVAPAGVVGAVQNDPAGTDFVFHSCSVDNRCPLEPGETLVSSCDCLDEFPEAIAMMQTVRLAGADLLCTANAAP